MGDFFDLSTVARRVRFFGILEAPSWALLLLGSVLKRADALGIADQPIKWPVMVFGMLHGVIFLAYAFSVLLASREFEWPGKTTLLGLFSTVVPFASVFFERWVIRSGQLGELSEAAAPAAARS
ncbi:DUF3817 domain-containing protein [Nocardia acidivorans]|uniref:DUF3817 domain-containing protein n=1 Tax=Nocardia acidivorans TaxID=404580 RepID=UPI0009FDEE78|nr:DUF3817 domain-containing protein [Nocardia acidivorans]